MPSKKQQILEAIKSAHFSYLEEKAKLFNLPTPNLAEVSASLDQAYQDLQIFDKKIESLAQNLFHSGTHNFDTTPNAQLLIKGQKRNIRVLIELVLLAKQANISYQTKIIDDEFSALVLNSCPDSRIIELAGIEIKEEAKITHRISVKSNPDPRIKFDLSKLATHQKFMAKSLEPYSSGAKHYTLTVIPTEADADLDGMDYNSYLDLFFTSCNQPWEQIAKAQAILIKRFNQGQKVHITNSDGTDLSFDITGMTFVNSVTLKNIPGSELFSAPRRDGVNGKLVAKGNFRYGNYGLISDIILHFKNGRVYDFDATTGKEILAKIIESDDGHGEGARHVGELAFGTNPSLRKHLVNSLLVEKIGYSFHIALGKCYTYKEYAGQKVHVDNGNTSHSGIHWDITTMLGGKDGKVYLDDKLVQDNGIWVDEAGDPDCKLAVLNGGDPT